MNILGNILQPLNYQNNLLNTNQYVYHLLF
jgi:hypothetical protein